MGDLEIAADLSGEKVVDLSVTRNCGGAAGGAVHVDSMFAAFSKELAAMPLEVPDQIIALHAEAERSPG